jgi:transketolase N-terminal domain/subunit
MSATPSSQPGSAPQDSDAQETREWLDALSAVIGTEGGPRAHFLLEQLLDHARQNGIDRPFSANTAYVNTIPTDQEERCPGNIEIEERLRAYMRWNAMAMVVKANRHNPEDGGDLGGHIGSFASLAHLFGAGFNHFWHAENGDRGGDCVYIQGHVAPGVYARAFLEGRLTEEQLLNFRQEVDGKGLSSYPHPKLMPEFWQFPTVSMGLGPLMAIYQARFLKYLHARGIADTSSRKVWVFCGDGEMDEVESLGAIGLAAREKLDNLIFVINCNLQRLDGPVRGNGKIIQELEGEFRGAGFNHFWHAESANHGGDCIYIQGHVSPGVYARSILDALYLRLANRVHYMGANAGSETFQPMPCLFDNDRVIQHGVLTILLEPHRGAILEHGYEVPGQMITATSTEGNRILQIDWRPAFDVYRELALAQYGVEVNRDNFYDYAVHFPFGIVRANGITVVRIPLALEADGSLFCVGEVPANAVLALLRAPAVDSRHAQATLINGLTELNGALDGQDLLLFYCAGRRLHLGIQAACAEISALSEASRAGCLGGALSLGEIGSTTQWGYPLFHNATLVASLWSHPG